MTMNKQDFVKYKIKKLTKEGYDDPKQRIAIALSMAREEGFEIPKSLAKKKMEKDKTK